MSLAKAREHSVGAFLDGGGDGSSPRARGTLLEQHRAGRELRFIPAGAGNTIAHIPLYAEIAVHPRGRGEHIDSHGGQVAGCGSSPRARGTRRSEPSMMWLSRFIPAGAGNTSFSTFCPVAATVHPRGRGEHNRER